MGYLNPLLNLPAGQALLALPRADRERIEAVMRELRGQANTEAEKCWRRRKGPMAAYWRAVATYARHLAHALSRGRVRAKQSEDDCPYCTREACGLCDATGNRGECEHDVVERHAGVSYPLEEAL